MDNSQNRPPSAFGKMSPGLRKALMRLEKDRQELIDSPVANVSAAPLDSNMLEWHCNIGYNDFIFHVILFFPQDYPSVPPSAEFVPHRFMYSGGSSDLGKKGTKICLNILSDFAEIHTEWKTDRETGWSPGYTVQTILLNVISFLSEINNFEDDLTAYTKLCKHFVCRDCGHSLRKPFPPVDSEQRSTEKSVYTTVPLETQRSQVNDISMDKINDHLHVLSLKIVDYYSKETFSLGRPSSSDQLFGYGLVLSGRSKHPNLRSPCEFLTVGSFKNMVSSLGKAMGAHRDELRYFLPLYITAEHGSRIGNQFVESMECLGGVLLSDSSSRTLTDIIIKAIPNLMCSTVVQFSKSTGHAGDNVLEGYFALHRLFLGAMDTYPDLRKEVNKQLENFVSNDSSRLNTAYPDIGQWLILLSVSGTYTWELVAHVYLREAFSRNVKWYIKTDRKLANMTTPMDYRLTRTFELTKVNRNFLAFQVAFLKSAKPEGMSRGDILKRYDNNLGFPSSEMVHDLRKVFSKVKDVACYDDWFNVIGVPVPSKETLYETLKESVKFASSTEGYFFAKRNELRRR